MKAEDLKNSILQLAMEGKLVPQNPNDEPASVLLEKIRDEKERLIKAKKIKRNNKESFIFRKNGHFYEKIGKNGNPICIDDEIPFEVPDSWEWVRINTIREVYTGNSINKTEKETKFTGLTEGYNYIATKDVKFDNSLDYDNGVKIPKDLEKFRIAPEGSVLLCIEGGSAGRKIGILNQDVCFGNKLACFKTFKDNNDFLFYYLQSPNFKEIFKSKKTGIIGGVGIAKLRNVLIPIPPLNEQKRIINEINKLNPLINEYGSFKEQLDKLNSEFPDKLKSSILQEAIQGKLVPQDSNDEPSSVLLERIRNEKERLIKEKKIKRNKNESFIFKENNHFYEKINENGEKVSIDEEIPFEIPDNWTWVRLNSLGLIVGGGTPKTKVNEYWANGKIPWLTPADMKFIKGKYVSHGQRNITELGLEKSSTKLMPKNSIIYSSRAPIGYIAISKNELCTNQGFKSLVPFYEKIIDYIYYCLIALTHDIQSKASGTTFKEISGTKFGEILIPLPPLNEQDKIVNKIEELIYNLNF